VRVRKGGQQFRLSGNALGALAVADRPSTCGRPLGAAAARASSFRYFRFGKTQFVCYATEAEGDI
jgi:hypothetical protein